MTTYLLRRSLQGLLVLFAASFLTFTVLTYAPGGPLSQWGFNCPRCPRPTPEQWCKLQIAFKLDKPWPMNYLAWLFDPRDFKTLDDQNRPVTKGIDIRIPAIYIGNIRIGPSQGPQDNSLFAGRCDAYYPKDDEPAYDGWQIRGSGLLTLDLGRSMVVQRGVLVTDAMGARIGNTLILMVSSFLLSLLIAFPIGIISAIRQYSRLDYAVTTFSFFGLSMPSFWLGLMLIIFFAVLPHQWHTQGATWLPYLPTGNLSDIDQDGNILNRIYHLILPVSVLTFINIAGWSRFIRGSMLEVLRQDYVRTAWAKGLSGRAVILKHALRNALIPFITILTLAIPGLVQGAIITEAVFNYAGMGRLFIEAVNQVDFPIIMGFLLLVTALVILSNMLADVLFGVVDPRIR